MSGKRFALAGALMGSTALGITMTAAERSKGRLMRAPDGHDAGGTGDAAFDAFNEGAEVEVGKPAIETNEAAPEKKPAKPSGRGPREKPAADGAAKPAADADDKAKGKGADKGGDDDDDADDKGGEHDEDDDDEDGEEKPAKPRRASDRIRELTSRTRSQERLISQLSQRLEAVEKGGLPAGNSGGNSGAADKAAPDPTDESKYPLGHLDDRYIEDKLEWLAEQKATKLADAALQRQQGQEQDQRAQEAHEALLEKVDDLSTRGSDIYDDFQETVVEAGLAGKWDLGQATFEAAHEAENGAQILYELANDKKEASRVAKLSPYGQMKFVMDRDAAITAKGKPRTKPGAGEPPATRTRGANSSAKIDPATDDLGDFEKAWAADEKASR